MKKFYVLILTLLIAGNDKINAAAADDTADKKMTVKEAQAYLQGLGYKLNDGKLTLENDSQVTDYIKRLNIQQLPADKVNETWLIHKALMKKPLQVLDFRLPTPAATSRAKDIVNQAFAQRRDSFAGKRITPEQQAKIDTEEKRKKEARAAAKAAGTVVKKGDKKK